jgi:hypothetical protein
MNKGDAFTCFENKDKVKVARGKIQIGLLT